MGISEGSWEDQFERVIVRHAADNPGPSIGKPGLESHFCFDWYNFRAEHSEAPEGSRSQRQGLEQAGEDFSSRIYEVARESIRMRFGFC